MTLTLGDNRRVDLSQCISIMTSNLGAREMSKLIEGGLGFARHSGVVEEKFDDKIDRSATDAARRKFTPEFMNRIDKMVVFKTLRPEHLYHILEIELGMVQRRIQAAASDRWFEFNCTPAVKAFLLQQGTDARYGARHLKRAVERHLVAPMANLLASAQVRFGDVIRIDRTSSGDMVFTREPEARVAHEQEDYRIPSASPVAAHGLAWM
jgi:ATP-dependent Clp protease ATP-binding subunit ClpB